MSLRDFPQNLLDIQTLALWGKLAGAEASPTKRAIRRHRLLSVKTKNIYAKKKEPTLNHCSETLILIEINT